MSDQRKIALNRERFGQAIRAHDEINPPPHSPAHGIGLAHFDMERLGFEEGEELWAGIRVEADGGQSATFRVLCDGDHSGEGERIEATVRDAAGVGA